MIMSSSLVGAVLVKNVGNRVFGPSLWSNSQTPAIWTGQIDWKSVFPVKFPMILLLTSQWRCDSRRTLWLLTSEKTCKKHFFGLCSFLHFLSHCYRNGFVDNGSSTVVPIVPQRDELRLNGPAASLALIQGAYGVAFNLREMVFPLSFEWNGLNFL